MLRVLVSAAGFILLSGCSLVGIRSGYEQPAYTVVARIGENVEIRRYASRVAAEATVNASGPEAGRDEAFRVLFDYISGANQGQTEVAMTTPVEATDSSEKIAMTAPVETDDSTDGRYTMRFFLPASYTPDTAPSPTDPRVEMVEIPATNVAVLRFSGSRDEERVDERKAELMETVATSEWVATGNPTALFYDPPWTVPFLRRNEVAVAVDST